MTAGYVGLIRGINVGRAKRVAMADLRALVEELGYSDVRTLLNSGNIVFTASGTSPADAAARIEEGLATRIGVPARVTVLTNREIAQVIAENPLLELADDPSRLMIAVLTNPADRTRLEPLVREDWSPEAMALGSRVAYLWCPHGVVASPLSKAVGGALDDAVTTRNWSTMKKLHALTDDERPKSS